jgi:hypothetical protein
MKEPEKKEPGKIVPISLEGLEFENDFGQSPIGLGHFSLDQGFIAVGSLVCAFVGAAVGGVPLAAIVLIAGLNDIKLASRNSSQSEQKAEPKVVEQLPEQEAIEVPAQVVEEKQEAIPLSVPTPPVDQPTSEINPTSQQTGQEILDALARTRRSTLLIGDTGAGKSVTQAYLLAKLFELHPDAEVFGIAQKADSFCGLAEQGRVTLFDPTEPEQALFLIHSIWLLYDQRRRLPESKRPALPPVRLILADWLSINQSLMEMRNDEVVKASRYLSRLADVIYNGRELNVCLLVDLQSYNLAAVGLKADRNSRKNFNLIGLGNYSIDELGMVNESYGVLTNLIGDRYIVAEESERSALNAAFKELQPISKASRRPIIFSGLSPARLALLPDLREYKNSTVVAVANQPVTVTEPTTETQPEEEVIAPPSPTTELRVSDSLGEPLKSIWLFAKKKSDWVTAKDVYNNGMAVLKGKGVKQIRQYFGLLADSGLGEIDEMDGDKPKSDSSVGFRAY